MKLKTGTVNPLGGFSSQMSSAQIQSERMRRGVLGIILRKLQYETDDDEAQNWDGEPAWWIQFVNDEGPMWSYEEELTLVTKGTHLSLSEVSLLPVTKGN